MKDMADTVSVADESLLGRIADDYMTRLSCGDSVNVEEYVERYPRLAKYIRQVFPAFAVMNRSITETHSDNHALQAASGAGGQLGDYRIVREIGRGGMGVVYEAEQISLGRRVALKVLPFAAVLDQRQLQRFKNEAQAAAQLHHTNIVPVFSVGCERGVHYYAMQYIEGSTLASVIGELSHLSGLESTAPDDVSHATCEVTRTLTTGSWAPSREKGAEGVGIPTAGGPAAEGSSGAVQALASEYSTRSPAFFRSIALLGVQAAEALDHAHESGVIHRDIKPSNLLLDAQGHLWITDFGLARLESEPGMTMTGDILGTVRYMSPEQALAKRIPIDHRTDIYSLGVTLYELLTLQPAFTGRDRQELLRQIAFEEPRLPRRLNRSIPPELETIVLKAVNKNPEQRYATAQDLADDLERFLEYKPIQAKRPTLVQRAAKWSMRHRAVVGSGVALLVMAVIALSASTALIWREQTRTAAALTDAKTQRAEADDQRARAEANFKKAREAVDQMLTQVAEKLPTLPGMPDTPDAPEVREIKKALLEDALAYYEEFLHEQGDDPMVRYEAAHAYLRVGEINRSLDQVVRAEETYRAGIEILEDLNDEFPKEANYRDELGGAYRGLGRVLADVWRYPEAEAAYRRAIQGDPDHADAVFGLSEALQRNGRLRDAEDVLRRYIARLEHRENEWPDRALTLGWTYASLAELLAQDRPAEAESMWRKTIAFVEDLVAGAPDNVEYRNQVGHTRHQLAGFLDLSGRFEESAVEHRLANEIFERLATEHPDDPEYLSMLSHGYTNLGRLLINAGKYVEAEAVLRKSVDLSGDLVRRYPHDPDFSSWLAGTYGELGDLVSTDQRYEEARNAWDRAVEMCRQLASEYPEVPQYRVDLAGGYFGLARMLKSKGATEWEAYFRSGAALQEQLIAEFPFNLDLHRQFAGQLKGVGRIDKAVDLLQRGVDLGEQLLARYPDQPEYGFWLVQAYEHLAVEYANYGSGVGIQSTFRRAVALGEQLVSEYPGEPRFLAQLAGSYFHWGSTMWGRSRTRFERHEHLREGLALEERLVAEHPRIRTYQAQLAEDQHYYASSLLNDGLAVEAADLLRKSIAIREKLDRTDYLAPVQLLRCYQELIEALRATGKTEEAEEAYRRSDAIRREVLAESPGMPAEFRRSGQWRSLYHTFVDYRVQIGNPGVYQLYLRAEGHDLASDSCFVDVVELADGPGGTIADFYYLIPDPDADFETHPWGNLTFFESLPGVRSTSIRWSILEPGDYTIRIATFETGTAIDALVFQMVGLPAPASDQPDESARTTDGVFLESGGSVVAEAEHFTSRWPSTGECWRIVPDEDPGDVTHRNFRGTGYIQHLPDQSPGTEKKAERYDAGVEADPDNVTTYRERGFLRLYTLLQYRAAVEDFSDAIELEPGDGQIWYERGNAHAELSEWDMAARDFAETVRLAPENARAWYKLALTHLASGNREAYRKTCAEMWARFGAAGGGVNAASAIWTCSLARSGIDDIHRFVGPSAQLGAGFPLDRFHLTALGAASYRAGDLDASVWRLTEASGARSTAGPPRLFQAHSQFLLSMAHWRMDDPENQERARQLYGQAVSLAEDEVANLPGWDTVWWDRALTLKLLQVEAAELLGIELEPSDEDSEESQEEDPG